MYNERWKRVSGHNFKMFHEEEYCNIIFSNQTIEMDNEANNIITNKFTKPDPVYSRCYFAKPVGKVSGQNFYHELWIDGKLINTTYFKEAPDPEWDQIQIWISEDEYKKEFMALSSGEYEIIVWVIKNIYDGNKEEWSRKRLSKGSFIYVVPEGMGGKGIDPVIDLTQYSKVPDQNMPENSKFALLQEIKATQDAALKEIESMEQDFNAKLDSIKNDTELIIEYTSQIEALFDKQENLEIFLKDKLQSDFDKIKDSWQDYKAGKIGKKELIAGGLKAIGKTFVKRLFERVSPI